MAEANSRFFTYNHFFIAVSVVVMVGTGLVAYHNGYFDLSTAKDQTAAPSAASDANKSKAP